MRLINQIIVHCSATPNGVYVSPGQIDAWHAAPPNNFKRQPSAVAAFNRALPHIGYHWVITADGRQHTGRATEEVGAHVKGFNANSIGICMTGTNRFYLRQWQALADVICDLAYVWQTSRLAPAQRLYYPLRPVLAMQQLGRMGIEIKGHRDLSPDKNGDGKITSVDWLKICPGFDVDEWLATGTEMMPDAEHIFDEHPAIASATAIDRRANAQ